MSERPLAGFKLLTDNGKLLDEDNSLFQTWCFLRDMADIQRQVLDTWEKYMKGELTPITASLITTQAVAVVREMDTEFARDHSFDKKYTDHRHILTKALGLRSTIPHFDLVSGLVPHKYVPYADLVPSPTWEIVSAYLFSAEPGVARLTEDGFFMKPVAEYSRDSVTPQYRFEEDKGLIGAHMAEVHLAIIVSGWEALKPRLVPEVDLGTRGKCPNELALVAGMRYLLAHTKDNGGDGRIPTHIVFEWIYSKRSLTFPDNIRGKRTRNIRLSAAVYFLPLRTYFEDSQGPSSTLTRHSSECGKRYAPHSLIRLMTSCCRIQLNGPRRSVGLRGNLSSPTHLSYVIPGLAESVRSPCRKHQ